jgi:hypothetical protein
MVKRSTSERAKATRDATCDGLKRIYLIVLGLAITQALTRTFSDQTGFLGIKLEDPQHLTSLLLLIAFLPTVIRFGHGGVLHFSVLSDVRKWRRDMFGLLLQAILFYVTSLATDDVFLFLSFFVATLVLDTLWLLVIAEAGHPLGMELQWLGNNVLLLAISVVLLISVRMDYVSAIAAAACIALCSLVAAIYDYAKNKDDYFPPLEETHPGG